MGPTKIDGFGVRIAGATTTVNDENRTRFVRMYASVPLAKGEAVALDFSDTEPTNGYGNHVGKALMTASADAGSVTNRACHVIGIAAEAAAVIGDIVEIQVAGVCDFAICNDVSHNNSGTGSDALADADEGTLLTVSAEGGRLGAYDTSVGFAVGGDSLPAAILIEYGTADTADSTVYLLNPANL